VQALPNFGTEWLTSSLLPLLVAKMHPRTVMMTVGLPSDSSHPSRVNAARTRACHTASQGSSRHSVVLWTPGGGADTCQSIPAAGMPHPCIDSMQCRRSGSSNSCRVPDTVRACQASTALSHLQRQRHCLRAWWLWCCQRQWQPQLGPSSWKVTHSRQQRHEHHWLGDAMAHHGGHGFNSTP
jgi:hypothetical protein